jgi:hypothetical protein
MWQVVTEEIRHCAKVESTGEMWNASTVSLKMRMQMQDCIQFTINFKDSVSSPENK